MDPQLERRRELANLVLGVGILLLLVPIGLALMVFITRDPQDGWFPFWAFIVILCLLPFGAGFFAGGLAWLGLVDRRYREMELLEDEAEEERIRAHGGYRPR